MGWLDIYTTHVYNMQRTYNVAGNLNIEKSPQLNDILPRITPQIHYELGTAAANASFQYTTNDKPVIVIGACMREAKANINQSLYYYPDKSTYPTTNKGLYYPLKTWKTTVEGLYTNLLTDFQGGLLMKPNSLLDFNYVGADAADYSEIWVYYVEMNL